MKRPVTLWLVIVLFAAVTVASMLAQGRPLAQPPAVAPALAQGQPPAQPQRAGQAPAAAAPQGRGTGQQQAAAPRLATREILDDVYQIALGLDSVCMYVLVGRDKALVVDTQTMTDFEGKKIIDYVRDITTKPLIVVNTHPHGDHTAANAQFGEVHLSVAGVEEIKAGAAKRSTPIAYTLTGVKEGHVFDLGDRQIEVIDIPAHSSGSIALLDRKAGYLFTGDEIDPGQVVGMNPKTIQLHHANMKKLYDKVLQPNHPPRAGAQRRPGDQAVHQVLHGPRRQDHGWNGDGRADGRRSELRVPRQREPGPLPRELRGDHLHETRPEVGAGRRGHQRSRPRRRWRGSPGRAALNRSGSRPPHYAGCDTRTTRSKVPVPGRGDSTPAPSV